ncbi:hypothetical protein OUZ56_013713 [Daphnia magna]|uniref:Uncharacterized protein n=1 Tax=Daphnia magna TaxID=35525 RepID=A0ABQ9Z6Q8_9CRUS|nr:hypothetical protein OUZ56_013713 [Daphnia magna]
MVHSRTTTRTQQHVDYNDSGDRLHSVPFISRFFFCITFPMTPTTATAKRRFNKCVTHLDTPDVRTRLIRLLTH